MEALKWIEPSLNDSDLTRRVNVDKLFDVQVTAADPNIDLTPVFNLDVDPFGSKRVDALGLPQKHDLHFIAIWILVYERSQSAIDIILLSRNVKTMTLFKLCILLYEHL